MRVIEFLKEISDEIQRIKSMATSAEKAKLNINNFSRGSSSGTIYGLLTGSHNSDRAILITKKKYRHLEYLFSSDELVNGSVVTAVEKYMYYNGNDCKENRDVLDFIIGKIPSVTLSIDGHELKINQSSTYFELHEVNEIKI